MDQYNVYDVAEKIFAAIQKEREGMTHMNVMVMGKTGSGKSTLINNMFNEKLADTGIGKPVTQAIRQYSKEGFPLTIYDTPGLELGGDNAISELLKDATDCIKKGVKSGKMDDAIHCILYCVNAGTHRFEDAEKEFIAQFLSENKAFNIPVIVVITQAVNKKDAAELKRIIEAENMDIIQVVPVLCQAVEITDEITIPAYGLDTLAEIIYRVIPEALQKTFVAVQKADIKLKTSKAQAIVVANAAAAAGVGAVPIPFADSFVLVPQQIGMLGSITAAYGLALDKTTIVSVVSGVLGIVGTTIVGKTAVSGILKLIPGAGSVAGGVVSGGVAAALTAALGEAYIGVMTKIAKGELKVDELGTAKGQEWIKDLFRERLKLKRNDKGVLLDKKDELVVDDDLSVAEEIKND